MGKLFSICFFNIGNLWDFYNFAFQTRLNDEDNKVILPENKYFPRKEGILFILKGGDFSTSSLAHPEIFRVVFKCKGGYLYTDNSAGIS